MTLTNLFNFSETQSFLFNMYISSDNSSLKGTGLNKKLYLRSLEYYEQSIKGGY